MIAVPEYLSFRDDVEVIAQASPGKADRHVLRDPRSGLVLECTEKEMFLCRALDGATPLPEIHRRFEDRFHVSLEMEQLHAFVKQLDENGLLRSSAPLSLATTWDDMKTVPVASDRILRRLAGAFGWCFHGYALALFGVFLLLAAVILSQYAETIAYHLAHWIEGVKVAAARRGASAAMLFRISLILVFIPLLREVAKGVACRTHGYPVPQIRYLWFMRLIPRFGSDLGALARVKSKALRLRILSAGLAFEGLLLALALLFYELLPASNPAADAAFSVAVAAAISLLVNANPFGQQDGSLLLAVGLDLHELRPRAVRTFRDWIRRRPIPEPMGSARHRWFVLYGACCELWTAVLHLAVFGLAAYLFTSWLEGLGFILFLLLVTLRFEASIRSFVPRVAPLSLRGTVMPMDRAKKKWITLSACVIGLVVLVVVPYPREFSGEFRIQPGERQDIRAEVEGQIEAVLVAVGERVNSGQPIVRLSSRVMERDLAVARAGLEHESQILRGLKEGPKPEEIARSEQAVRLAEIQYDHSSRKYERLQSLYDKEQISVQEHENALKERDVDREALELARRSLALTSSGVTEAAVAAQAAEVERLRIQVDFLEESLSLATLHSPIGGVVTTLYLEGKVGQRVGIGDVVAVVEENRRVYARIALPEQFVGDIAVGARVRLKSWAYPGDAIAGEVQSISPIALQKTEDLLQEARLGQEVGGVRNLNLPEERVVIVLAEIDNSDGRLRTDMTGQAKIDGGWTSVGGAFLDPLIRFVQVRVWSWIP